jgi:hypothetical protein
MWKLPDHQVGLCLTFQSVAVYIFSQPHEHRSFMCVHCHFCQPCGVCRIIQIVSDGPQKI